MGSPVLSRLNIPRDKRYPWPRWSASATGVRPPERWNSKSPSSTLMVVWQELRSEPDRLVG